MTLLAKPAQVGSACTVPIGARDVSFHRIVIGTINVQNKVKIVSFSSIMVAAVKYARVSISKPTVKCSK